jgi:putative ABC transport system substrate-binding protein
VRRIGVLANEPWPALEGLHVGLDELGYGEGVDFVIEYRFAEGAAGRFPGLAAELVGRPVDVIVTCGTPATLAALKATSSIPIVMSARDPVGVCLVASLARPGGNVTGLSSQTAGGEEKRLELLKELRPNLLRVAVLSNPTNPYCVIAVQQARRGAAAIGGGGIDRKKVRLGQRESAPTKQPDPETLKAADGWDPARSVG